MLNAHEDRLTFIQKTKHLLIASRYTTIPVIQWRVQSFREKDNMLIMGRRDSPSDCYQGGGQNTDLLPIQLRLQKQNNYKKREVKESKNV